jgi:DMSO/TMAO reductase YedYZ molybdopterin-dependent catalytic subunit
VTFLKAMQCLNISTPLGQGLWTGVPLREVLLHFCGKMTNVRRIYYAGYHNNDPKQLFRSSMTYTQVMETPPGELPAFIAYKLNDEPISLLRGGPVRMVVPWAHGFKSIKWLQQISLTNDWRANDTYANANNDPESFLKTAAYVDSGPEKIAAGEPVILTGQVICGLSGLSRVEYWVRPVGEKPTRLADDDPELLAGPWTPCAIDDQPDWRTALPEGVSPKKILGFDPTSGTPMTWPLRYSMVGYSATIRGLKPGRYEIRARAVDQNGFAQPEPRPAQKTGKKAIQMLRVEVT